MKPSYELTWHHTVSLITLTLTDDWNWMREGEHWEAMRLYLDCAGMANIDEVIHEIQTSNVQDKDALMTAIQWPSWNT